MMLVTKVIADEVVAALEPFKGKDKVIKISLPKDEEEGPTAFMEAYADATSTS